LRPRRNARCAVLVKFINRFTWVWYVYLPQKVCDVWDPLLHAQLMVVCPSTQGNAPVPEKTGQPPRAALELDELDAVDFSKA
jgi:hypothetical protein